MWLTVSRITNSILLSRGKTRILLRSAKRIVVALTTPTPRRIRMRRCLTAMLVVALVTITSREAAAQPTVKDLAAYAALNLTPIGALSPIMISPGTKGEKTFSSFAGRVSHHAPKTGDGSNSFGASYYMPAGSNAAVSGTLGYLKEAGTGGEGIILAGLDVNSTLWN